MSAIHRTLAADLPSLVGSHVLLRGWVFRLRVLAKTTFIIMRDCSGDVQCVAPTEVLHDLRPKVDDAIELRGVVRRDGRARGGIEIDIASATILNRAGHLLPFTSSSDVSAVGLEILTDYRPLSLRNDRVGDIFRIQAAILRYFRDYLTSQRFTEIVSSKIVASGTEGGTNLFEIKYFDRVAYLAQSPQFYKEHGVVGFERVFETGHVYRAEPHATSRHLTEYYSLDFEIGFIDGPEDVIQVERELLSYIFDKLNNHHGAVLGRYRSAPLPSMLDVPIWTFDECLERLSRADLADDLDPEAERQLCRLAERDHGVAAVFVLGFPLAARPFYTHPRTETTAAGFDLLFNGIEITTGGQRLHRRSDLERALGKRGISPAPFESHLKMFELGMPPHGGLAIGLERLTAQILGLQNVREATLYPRDRYRVTP
ncbi:MAG TPA: aspartate--tRNA(Asn) ligase [Vicinamibacterales bacterium]|nr:aspartate--tRNA(Asn) ligase [Vicinamibacterales bacterium]